MRNEQLLNEIEELFKTYDKDFDELCVKVAELQGIQKEMIRHNGEKFEELKRSYDAMHKSYDKILKWFGGIIVVLLLAILGILGLEGINVPILAVLL